MKAPQLRTIVISKPLLVDVQAALDLLRNGAGLTAGESGVVAYAALDNVELGPAPVPVWDGLNWNVFLFVSAG